MQQRRVRLGDILDDYCPRERRITNHAVVAMIDDQVKQTRCTTCQSDHEYKAAKVPPPRRKKTGALTGEEAVGVIRPRPEPSPDAAGPDESIDTLPDIETDADVELDAEEADVEGETAQVVVEGAAEPPADDGGQEEDGGERDEWPVHRPLIRAQLPRPEGQTPERKQPDFTLGPGGTRRFDANRNGKRPRGHRPMRHGQGQGQGQQGQGFGQQGPRHGAGQGQGRGPRQGGGPGGPQGQRGNRPGQGGGRPAQGPGRGPRPGSGGGGRKRGR